MIVDRSGGFALDRHQLDASPGRRASPHDPRSRAALRGRSLRARATRRRCSTRSALRRRPDRLRRRSSTARCGSPTRLSTVDARILRYWLILAAIAAIVLAVGARSPGLRHGALRDASAARARAARRRRSAAGQLSTRARRRTRARREVRSLAAVFNETVVEARQLLRSQEEFVADASHQLRTPLTALRLRLENLERNVDDAAAQISRARSRGRPAVRASSRACSRSRARTPARGPGRRRRRRRANASRRGRRSRRSAASRSWPSTDGALIARAARERVAQVLDNFVENALEASPSGVDGHVSPARCASTSSSASATRGRVCTRRPIARGRSIASGAPGAAAAARASVSRSCAARRRRRWHRRARRRAGRRHRRRRAAAASLTALPNLARSRRQSLGRALSRCCTAAP